MAFDLRFILIDIVKVYLRTVLIMAISPLFLVVWILLQRLKRAVKFKIGKNSYTSFVFEFLNQNRLKVTQRNGITISLQDNAKNFRQNIPALSTWSIRHWIQSWQLFKAVEKKFDINQQSKELYKSDTFIWFLHSVYIIVVSTNYWQ